MAFEVAFNRKADQDFYSILEYIQSEFGIVAANDFKNLVIDFIPIIASFPEIGIIVDNSKKIRGLVVHKRLKVFYRIKGKKIIILRLFDTRQHPDSA